jgi:hypothetical protein
MISSHIKLDIYSCLRKHHDLIVVSYGPIGPVVLRKPNWQKDVCRIIASNNSVGHISISQSRIMLASCLKDSCHLNWGRARALISALWASRSLGYLNSQQRRQNTTFRDTLNRGVRRKERSLHCFSSLKHKFSQLMLAGKKGHRRNRDPWTEKKKSRPPPRSFLKGKIVMFLGKKEMFPEKEPVDWNLQTLHDHELQKSARWWVSESALFWILIPRPKRRPSLPRPIRCIQTAGERHRFGETRRRLHSPLCPINHRHCRSSSAVRTSNQQKKKELCQ